MPGQKPPTMDDVWSPGKTAAQTGDDYARDLGKGVMDGITGGITSIIGQTFSGLGKNGSANGTVDPIDALVAAEQKKKALREYLGLDGDGSRRLRRRDDDDEDGDRPRRRDNSVDMLKVIVDMMDKSEARTSKIIEKMDANNRELLKEIRDDVKGKGGQDPQKDILAGVGLQVLQSRATGDPAEEERARRRSYFEEFEQVYGGGNGRKTPEDRRFDLEEKKLNLEDRRLSKQDEEAKKAAEDRNRLLGGFLSAVAGGSPLAGDGQDAAAQDPTQSQSRLYRYRCGACHKTFATVEPITHALCPHCGSEIGQGEGPPVNIAQQQPETQTADDALPAAAMEDEVPY